MNWHLGPALGGTLKDKEGPTRPTLHSPFYNVEITGMEDASALRMTLG